MSGQFILRTQSWRGGTAGLCHPRVHPHSFYRGALPVLGGGRPAQHHGRVEVAARVLAVAAVVGAAGAAQAVDGGAAQLLPRRRRRRRLLRLLRREAGGGDAVPGRGDRLRFDVDVLVGVDGEI